MIRIDHHRTKSRFETVEHSLSKLPLIFLKPDLVRGFPHHIRQLCSLFIGELRSSRGCRRIRRQRRRDLRTFRRRRTSGHCG